MKKRIVAVVAAAAFLTVGSASWQAAAQAARGASTMAQTARVFFPSEKAACQGRGRWCRPGFVRVCAVYRCWCRPCR